MKIKYFVILLLALVAVAGVSSCKHERKYRIAISQCSSDDWRRKLNDEILREKMFHENVEVEIRTADDNSHKQIDDIRYFADNDFDILVVSPNEADALTPVIEEVYNKGIPVILFDRGINGDAYTARLRADDEGIGKSAAAYAFSITGDAPKALEIYGLPGSTPAKGRHDGFVKAFTEGGGTILATVPGNWNQADATRVVDSLLDIYPDVDLIYAHNDRMAIGASYKAKEKGREGIRIIGVDAAPSIGIQAVADSVIDATFLYPTEGSRIVRTALDVLEGRPYERETILPSASAVDLSNADILLLQDENLRDETEKMRLLKSQVDEYWRQHSAQTILFYACVLIIVLLFGIIFLVLRAFWQHKRHRMALLEQNHELEQQRDRERDLNEKLQVATQSKLVFFTNVSHDLRTPLTLIAEPVAQLSAANNLTEQQHTLMKIADKNVRILHRLINQILDFRKYENNKLQLHLCEVDPVALVTEWLEGFESLARKRSMKLIADIHANDNCPTVALDIEKLERVFFNLVSNAFKYTPDNGQIRVKMCIADNKLTISVADNGEGISERDLGNIFERFYQVERLHPKGSGIGLTLSKAFVELHGGTIEVESTLNKGSEFIVTLPVNHVAEQASEIAPTISANDIETELGAVEESISFDESKPLLLVIDDNNDILTLITQLMQAGYNVITASDGADGIRKAVKYVPDLIICDVMMPVMDGLECCRRLKAEVSTSHIPVLMLTACSMDEQRVQGYESGADGYLAKPFSGAVLTARCSSLIANRKRIKELWQKSDVMPVQTKTKAPLPSAGDIDNDFYNRFIEIFTADISNADLSVDSLAASMGLERTQFYRKIKSLTNFSPVELIRNLRLKHARQLLKTTDLSISEIAYRSGFSAPAYFTRCYRETFGETPSETRTGMTE